MKKQFLSLIALSAIVLSSCGDGANKSTSGADSIGAPKPTTTQLTTSSEDDADEDANFLVDSKGLQQAEASLRALPQFKDKDIRVFQNIHFYGDGRIMLSLQDPSKPEHVDEYKFSNGAWAEPQPVQILAVVI